MTPKKIHACPTCTCQDTVRYKKSTATEARHQKSRQNRTQADAINRYKEWTSEEMDILHNSTESTMELAKRFGRTYYSVKTKRGQLRKKDQS